MGTSIVHYEVPQFDRELKCKECGRIGYFEGTDVYRELCGFCLERNKESERQKLIVAKRDREFVLFFSSEHANTDYRQLTPRGSLIYKVDLRLREPEKFFELLSKEISKDGWKESNWFIAELCESSTQRSFTYETSCDLNKIKKLSLFVIEYLATESKFLVNRNNRKVKISRRQLL
jgi:hypothetical protein